MKLAVNSYADLRIGLVGLDMDIGAPAVDRFKKHTVHEPDDRGVLAVREEVLRFIPDELKLRVILLLFCSHVLDQDGPEPHVDLIPAHIERLQVNSQEEPQVFNSFEFRLGTDSQPELTLLFERKKKIALKKVERNCILDNVHRSL